MWTPPPDVRATSRIGAVHGLAGGATGASTFDGLPRPVAVVGRRPRRVLGLASPNGRRAVARPSRSAVLGGAVDARRPWFPGGTLNYAEQALARGRDPARRRRGRRPEPDPRPGRAHVGRARRRGGDGAGPACGGSAYGEGDRVAAYLPNIPETLVAFLGDREPRVRSGRRARRSSAPAPSSTASRRSSRRCCSRSTATATARRSSTGATRSPRSKPRSRRCGTRCTSPYLGDGRRRLDGAARRARARSSSSRCRSTIRCTCSSARARPGCPRRSCTATAASPSSTSRRSRCTTTSAPATGSSGSPPPAG